MMPLDVVIVVRCAFALMRAVARNGVIVLQLDLDHQAAHGKLPDLVSQLSGQA